MRRRRVLSRQLDRQLAANSAKGRQGLKYRSFRKLRLFLYTKAILRSSLLALRSNRERKRAGPAGPAAKFAEPGTLSSTFPTNVPLPRTAPRGASSYRRPVLGAGATVSDPGREWQGLVQTNS